MLEANFSPETSRNASVTGAVQYDSGQRLRLRGLPAPQELAVEDELLSGDSVSVQVQFAYRGDSQSEPRPAGYDTAEGCWVCEVPDAYLTRASEVQVYVYVGYGADVDGKTRSKTMYTALFRPEGRPAPSDSVTPDQKNAWDALVAEVNLALSTVATATSGANAAAQTAQNAADNIGTAASDASAAAKAANEAAQRLNGMNPVRSINGAAPDENGEIAVTPGGIGAAVVRHYTLSFPASGWVKQSDGSYVQQVSADGVTSDMHGHADVDMSAATANTASELEAAWAMVGLAQTVSGALKLTAFDGAPDTGLTVILEVIC